MLQYTTPKDGLPLAIQPIYLVFAAPLHFRATVIVAPNQMNSYNTAPTVFGDFTTMNPLGQIRLKLIPMRWTSRIVTGSVGETMWGLFTDPNKAPAVGEFGRLRGHETPQVAWRASNKMLSGGGMAPPTDGNFDRDAVEIRCRHNFGGTTLDPRAAFVSNGS
jgi:hypothetical protein